MDALRRRQPTAFISPPTTARATALSPPARMYQKGKNAARVSTSSTTSSVLPKMTRSASIANEEIGHHTPSHFEFPFNNLEVNEHENCKSDLGASLHLPTLNGKSILNLIGELEESVGRNAVFKTSDRTQSCHNLSFNNSLGRRKSSSSAHGDIAEVCRIPPMLPERRPLCSSIGGNVAPVAVKPTALHAKNLGKDDDYSYFIPFAHSDRDSSATPLRCPQWVYDLLDSEASSHDDATSSKCPPQRNQKLCSPPIAPKPTNLTAAASSHNSASVPGTEQENGDVQNLFLTLSTVDKRTLALMMTEEDCRAFHLQVGSSEVLIDLFMGEKTAIPFMDGLIQRASLVHDSVKLLINEAAREGREKTLVRQLTELASTLLHDLGNAFAFGNIVSAIKEATLGDGQKSARMAPLPQTLAELIFAYEKICRDSINGCRQSNHPVRLLPFIQPFFLVPSLFAAAEQHHQALMPPKFELSVHKRMALSLLRSKHLAAPSSGCPLYAEMVRELFTRLS